MEADAIRPRLSERVMPKRDDPIRDALDGLSSEDSAAGVRVTSEPKTTARGPRWTREVVEVLDEARSQAARRRKRQSEMPPDPAPNASAMMSPEQVRELHMALGGALAARNLHERAESDLDRARRALRTAWGSAAVLGAVAIAMTIWAVASAGEKELVASVADTRLDMLSQQLATTKSDLARLMNRADKGEDRFGDARIRLVKLEAELAKAKDAEERLNQTQLELGEQQGYVTQLTTKLTEQQEAYTALRNERDTLSQRLTAMSRQLLETQRTLMKLREDMGLDDQNLTLPPLKTDFDKVLEENEQVGPPANPDPSPGARSNERIWRREH